MYKCHKAFKEWERLKFGKSSFRLIIFYRHFQISIVVFYVFLLVFLNNYNNTGNNTEDYYEQEITIKGFIHFLIYWL